MSTPLHADRSGLRAALLDATLVGATLTALLAVVLILAMVFAGCGSPSVPPNIPAAECVSHRTAKQLECVDLNQSKEAIDACRAKVRAELDCMKDGGTDGS